jgi:hypothetical protein
MTDETSTPASAAYVGAQSDRQSQVDQMVAAANARTTHTGRFTENHETRGHVTTKWSADGFTVEGAVNHADRIHDDGRDLPRELANMDAKVLELQGKLDQQLFDPNTGQPTGFRYVGQDRERMELLLTHAIVNRRYSADRFAEIEAQRVNDQAWSAAEADERAAKLAFTGGDPALSKVWEAEMAKAEASIAVQAALGKRFERGRI